MLVEISIQCFADCIEIVTCICLQQSEPYRTLNFYFAYSIIRQRPPLISAPRGRSAAGSGKKPVRSCAQTVFLPSASAIVEYCCRVATSHEWLAIAFWNALISLGLA